MKNYIEVVKENGDKFKIELILAFSIPEKNKDYIAYTMDDDPNSIIGMVLISEIDVETNKVKRIPESDKDIVLKAYEEAKKAVLNETV